MAHLSELAKACLAYTEKIQGFPRGSEEKYRFAWNWAYDMMARFPDYSRDWQIIIDWAGKGLDEIDKNQRAKKAG